MTTAGVKDSDTKRGNLIRRNTRGFIHTTSVETEGGREIK
jgi:hypothetical protein